MKRECETCIKRKTLYCPSTNECMYTDDMPYYQNRVMLLEENKKLNGAIQTYDILLKANAEENKQLQERIEYLERSNDRREDTILEQRQEISDLEDNWNKLKEYCADSLYFYDGYQREDLETDFSMQLILDKMQELEQGSDKNEDK